MTYEEWRQRSPGKTDEDLLKRALEILEEWQDYLGQYLVNGETLPGETQNFLNWGI